MEAVPDYRATRQRRRLLTFWILMVALVAVAVTGLLSGSVAVGLNDLWHMIQYRIGRGAEAESLRDSVLWAIRLPRVLAGVVVGAGLGIAGVALQGTFRNHMADPHLVGIAPAAGLGALAGLWVTPAGGSPLVMMIAAGIAGAILALLMRRIATKLYDTRELILVGLALGLGLLAILGAVVLAWDSPRVPTFTFWVFGGLSGTTWSTLGAATVLVVAGTAIVGSLARSLDLLALGEDEARHLGVDVRRTTTATLVGAGLVVGGAVGLTGVIGFVGLVVPLLLRRWVGPAHLPLMLLSALGGAVMLVAVDTAARTVAAPIEIPVGLLTSVLGAPVLVAALLRRTP